jgi:hypothetical protein
LGCLSGHTISGLEVVNSILGKTGDLLRSDEIKYLTHLKDVYRELNFLIIKDTKKIRIKLNKRFNSIYLPKDFVSIHSLSYEDSCKNLQTIFKGDNDEVIEDKQVHKCDCKNDTLKCNEAKFETIFETIYIPETSFDICLQGCALVLNGCELVMASSTLGRYVKLREAKKIMPDGSVYIIKDHLSYLENGQPQIVTRETHLCKLEVEECGCIKPIEENVAKLNGCGCANEPVTIKVQTSCNKGCDEDKCCDDKKENTYTVVEKKGKIFLSSNFLYETVVLKYYYEANKINEIEIPIEAKMAVQYGLMLQFSRFDIRNPTKYGMMQTREWERLYKIERDKLRDWRFRWGLDEFKMIVFGKT